MSGAGGMSESVAVQTSSEPALTLHEEDMPGLFKAADKASIKAQAQFFSWLRAELVLLTLAAAVAVFSTVNLVSPTVGPFTINGFTTPPITLVALAGAVLIAFALGARIYRYWRHFDTKWYEARAAAESVKSLAWRYAVGGRPFPRGGDEVAAKQLLIRRLEDTLTDVARNLQKTAFTDDEKITPAMQKLRDASLADRQEAYRANRIEDQETWYLKKSAWNKNRGLLWHSVLITVEALGVVGSGLLAVHLLPFSPQGVVAAIVSGIISWTQSKRYQDLEASYRVTASELGSIKQEIANQTTEAGWSTFVDEAEEACSREHRLWRATHDG
jgi:hypothetical protein